MSSAVGDTEPVGRATGLERVYESPALGQKRLSWTVAARVGARPGHGGVIPRAEGEAG